MFNYKLQLGTLGRLGTPLPKVGDETVESWVGGAIYLVFTGPDTGSPKLGFASESPLRGVLLICRDPAGSCCGQGQHEQSWECCLSRGKFPCCSLGLAQCPYVSCVQRH